MSIPLRVARDHDLVGHGFFIYDSIQEKGGVPLPPVALSVL